MDTRADGLWENRKYGFSAGGASPFFPRRIVKATGRREQDGQTDTRRSRSGLPDQGMENSVALSGTAGYYWPDGAALSAPRRYRPPLSPAPKEWEGIRARSLISLRESPSFQKTHLAAIVISHALLSKTRNSERKDDNKYFCKKKPPNCLFVTMKLRVESLSRAKVYFPTPAVTHRTNTLKNCGCGTSTNRGRCSTVDSRDLGALRD